MHVDEAGEHPMAGGVDFLGALAVERFGRHGYDPPMSDAQIPYGARYPRAVEDPTVADDHVQVNLPTCSRKSARGQELRVESAVAKPCGS